MFKIKNLVALLLLLSSGFYAEELDLQKLTGLALDNNLEIRSLKEMVKTLEIASRKESTKA